MVFIEGLLIGLGMVIFIGPVFFYLLKSTLEKNLSTGIIVATGIIISDIIIVFICSLGAMPFLKNANNQFWIGISGAIILIGLGIKYLFNPKIESKKFKKISDSTLSYFIQGFLINFVNPFVFFVWIGVITVAQNKHDLSTNFTLYIVGVLTGIYLTDLTKVFLAHRIKLFIQGAFLLKLYRIIGILLIIFGFRILIYVF